jgi:hypothetical protein
MAAMYQTLENTILTASALEKFSYDTMKEMIGWELGLEESKSTKDWDLIDQYYECGCFQKCHTDNSDLLIL